MTHSAPAPNRNSYKQILKSSAVIGGASVVNIAVSVVRSKAMALFIGPAGVGLVGLYSSIFSLTHSLAGMGVNQSGVRQIAEAAGSSEIERVARTAAVLRRTSFVLGIFGAALLAAFSGAVSTWTFGTREYAGPVALLSLAVFFSSVSDGQAALIQGLRRISDLARIGVLGAIGGSAVSIACIFFFRDRGVVPSLVSAAAITLIISWWYRRKIDIPSAPLTLAHVRDESAALLTLGSAFMASAFVSTGAAYGVRIIVRDNISLEAAGLYQAAWALGGMYVMIVLQAMGSDFYPRLTAVASDHPVCNRLVNEQAHVSLLLAAPGVVGTLTFAPIVVAMFYHTTFAGAVEPLRWVCLGMALRVVAWPMGYILMAKGARSLLLWVEIAATVVHIGLAFVLVRRFGLPGATMAFFGLYIWHGLLVYAIVRRLTGFRWSAANLRTGLFLAVLIGGVFSGFYVLPTPVATAVGALGTLVSGVYSLRVLGRLVPLDGDRAPRVVRHALDWITRPRSIAARAPWFRFHAPTSGRADGVHPRETPSL